MKDWRPLQRDQTKQRFAAFIGNMLLRTMPRAALNPSETGYLLHTLRQASRRSWLIGQRFPVRVKFIIYKGTMQETCLRLMGKKMLVALMMEGKLSGEGLQSLDTDEDLMSAMARELVEKAGVGQSADAVWRDLDREREDTQPHAATEESGDTAPDDVPVAVMEQPPLHVPSQSPVTIGIHLVEPTPEVRKRKRPSSELVVGEPREQLSLFG